MSYTFRPTSRYTGDQTTIFKNILEKKPFIPISFSRYFPLFKLNTIQPSKVLDILITLVLVGTLPPTLGDSRKKPPPITHTYRVHLFFLRLPPFKLF